MPPASEGVADHPVTPGDVVILLLEMQAPIVAASRTRAEADLRRGATVIRKLAEALDLPLHASIVPLGAAAPELIEELRGVPALVRSTVSAFADPAIRAAVSAGGRRTLVLGGVSSEIAILHAGRAASRDGYDVQVMVDLCGGLSDRTEATAFAQLRAAGATLSNIASFFTGLASNLAAPEGQQVMAAIGELWGWDRSG